MNELESSQYRDSNTDPPDIVSLIADLGSKDGIVRLGARQALVAMGEQALDALVKALANRKELVRWEAAKALDEINADWRHHADPTTVSALIGDLASEDGVVRVKARRLLVAIGEQALAPLTEALTNRRQWVRWEAAKALGEIGDEAAKQALIVALEDRMFDVRWLAAEGLITIGREAIVPLLQALIERSESSWLLEGAHHVLHDLASEGTDDVLRPVLAALEGLEPSVEAPLAAKTTLDILSRGGN